MIVEEPSWVSQHLKLQGTTAEEVAQAFRFRRLYEVRKAAGRFLFQLQLHEDPAIDPDHYNELMERALLWRRIGNDADAYLMSNDHYRSGGIVMGYIIAAQIRDALQAEWGPEWYRNKKLAERLTEGAQRGYAIPMEEFLAIWGLNAVDAGALSQQLQCP
jgi:hypothetical protein